MSTRSQSVVVVAAVAVALVLAGCAEGGGAPSVVRMVTPRSDTTVSGRVRVSAMIDASALGEIAAVELRVDDAMVRTLAPGRSVAGDLETAGMADGARMISVIA